MLKHSASLMGASPGYLLCPHACPTAMWWKNYLVASLVFAVVCSSEQVLTPNMFSLYAPIKWQTINIQKQEALHVAHTSASCFPTSPVICHHLMPTVHPACLHSTANTFGKSSPSLGLNFHQHSPLGIRCGQRTGPWQIVRRRNWSNAPAEHHPNAHHEKNGILL